MKHVDFVGSSRSDLRAFPRDIRLDMGYQLENVQRGRMPDSFKSMKDVGKGCYEIIENGEGTWFRIIYVATLGDTVYVLHAFQKKTNKTSRQDIQTAKTRYKEAVERAKGQK